MKMLKQAGIIAGATVGGIVGGTVSVIGAVTDTDVFDEIGASIIDSSIATGAIIGDIASGTADLVVGKISKNPHKISHAKVDLKNGGNKILDNVIENFQVAVDNSAEILNGIKEHDKEKTLNGVKTFLKLAAVGAVTAGAVKLSSEGIKSSKKSVSEEKNPTCDIKNKNELLCRNSDSFDI